MGLPHLITTRLPSFGAGRSLSERPVKKEKSATLLCLNEGLSEIRIGNLPLQRNEV